MRVLADDLVIEYSHLLRTLDYVLLFLSFRSGKSVTEDEEANKHKAREPKAYLTKVGSFAFSARKEPKASFAFVLAMVAISASDRRDKLFLFLFLFLLLFRYSAPIENALQESGPVSQQLQAIASL